MSYSLDFRQRVLAIKQKEKLTILQTAQRFCVSMRALFRWEKCPHPPQQQPRPARKINMDALKKDVERSTQMITFKSVRSAFKSRQLVSKLRSNV